MSESQEFFNDDGNVDDSKLKLPDVEFTGAAVTSGEDEETVLIETRARLMRFAVSVHTGAKEWKQRGTGQLKLLKHLKHGKVRLLLRQDKTLKICANHVVHPDMPLKPHPSSSKAFTFVAEDYADEEVKTETFCLMFRNESAANEFKEFHDKARAINAGDAAGDDGAATPAAAAAPEAAAAPAAGGKTEEGEAEEPIMFHNSVAGIYPDATEAATARIAGLTEKFRAKYGVDPNFFARAPGRVNLIGEHIDYHGYNVLPMAIQQDVLVAVAVTDAEDTISVASTVEKFSDGEVPANPLADVAVEGDSPEWFHYFQCGYKAAFAARGGDDMSHVGMKVMVDGTVPPSAGLSSSSAFVVASTLATAVANRIQLSKTQVASAAIAAEGYVGTMGGGMDQTISCLAKRGQAAQIQFTPLKAFPVTLPTGVVFVVGHSLKEAPKAFRPYEGYNCRVTEGKLAAKLVAKLAGNASWKTVKTVAELQQVLGLASPAGLLDLLTTHIKEEAFTRAQLREAFAVEDLATLFEGDPKRERALQVLENVDSYELHRRLRHVAGEASRVARFAELCSSELTDEGVTELGELLNQSHASLQADYACSCDELDTLVALCRDSGAVGARLTGAGWGGCMVAMVREAQLEEFLAKVGDKYYTAEALGSKARADVLFATAPGDGISVYLA